MKGGDADLSRTVRDGSRDERKKLRRVRKRSTRLEVEAARTYLFLEICRNVDIQTLQYLKLGLELPDEMSF